MDVSKPCTILEQTIDDPVTGLTFQFEQTPNGECRLHLFGDSLEFGNRTFMFYPDGRLAGAGVHTTGQCRPSYLVNLG